MSTPLAPWLRHRIQTRSPMPFEEFMHWALYHPEHGYYASGRVRVGRDEGDFTTAAHLSPLFARCLSRLVAAADKALGRPDPFTLVEGGPGEGILAQELLGALRDRHPDLYGRLRYALDEASPALLARQVEALAPHGKRVLAGFPSEPFRGLYLSNELIDAFPTHRLAFGEGRWAEVHVALGPEGFEEVLLPPSRPELMDRLEADGIQVPEGCQVEVNLRAEEWLARVAGGIASGFVVTVDYGDEAARLYGPLRPQGTCVAYRAHRLSDDLLADPGRQDLTAHVNFSALRRVGRGAGLEAAPLLKQRDLLFALGLSREMEDLERSLSGSDLFEARQALAPLLLPGTGMGEAFKALVQAKGLPLEGLPLDPERGLRA